MTTPVARLPKVRIVILNYNGGEYVLDSVEAALATCWQADRLEVVVIDNASVDGSADAIARRFPVVELRRRSDNGGFVANNDALIDLAGIDYVALINNDAFVEPGWLAPLVDALEADARLGAACAKVLFAFPMVQLDLEWTTDAGPRRLVGVEVDGQDRMRFVQPLGGFSEPHPRHGGGRPLEGLQASLRVPHGATAQLTFDGAGAEAGFTARCGTACAAGSGTVVVALDGDVIDVVNNAGNELRPGGYGADRGWLQPDGPRWDQEADVFAFCGNGVVLRPAFLADVGLFDEAFFAYYEDLDLSWRGQAAGWRYRYVPASRVRHLHASSAGAGSELFAVLNERNRLITLTKNAPWSQVVSAWVRHLLVTASYVRRDVVGKWCRGQRCEHEIVQRRSKALVGALVLVPSALRSRRAAAPRPLG